MTTMLTGTGTTGRLTAPPRAGPVTGAGARAIHHPDVALRRADVPGSAGDHETPAPGRVADVVGGWAGATPGGHARSTHDPRSLRGRRRAGWDTPHPDRRPGDRRATV